MQCSGAPAAISIVPTGLLRSAAKSTESTEEQVNPSRTLAGVSNESTEMSMMSALDLNESQLNELVDFVGSPTNRKSPPQLHCSSPEGIAMGTDTKYEWIFTDLNGSDHLIGAADGLVVREDYPIASVSEQLPVAVKLDLRQFVESKLMRQRRAKSAGASINFDVAAAIVGNFSCRANNSHGSISVSLPFKVTGRPLCKLEIGPKYISNKNELIIELLCNVYSSPALLETIWFRNNHQAHVNKSSLSAGTEFELASSALISTIKWHILAVDERQDFKLEEFIAQPNANFKCIARNAIGFSEPCELDQADKRTLAAIAATMTVSSSASIAPGANLANQMSENEIDGANNNNNNLQRWTQSFGSQLLQSNDKNSSFRMQLFTGNNQNLPLPTPTNPTSQTPNNNVMLSTAQLQASTSNWSTQLRNWLMNASKLDLILIGAGCLVLVWVLFVLAGGRLIGRKYPISSRLYPTRQMGSTAASTGWQSKFRRAPNRSSNLKTSSWFSSDTASNTSPSNADLALGRHGSSSTGTMLFQNGFANKHSFGVGMAASNYYANSAGLTCQAGASQQLIGPSHQPATTTTTTTTNGCDSQAGDSSEMDMIQSAGSQSSHYDVDPFVVQQQQQLFMHQHEPIHFNGYNSNGNSNHTNSMATLASSRMRQSHQQQTMSPPTLLKGSQTSARSAARVGSMVLNNNHNSNVPLINGTQNSSRIQLDYAQTATTSDAAPVMSRPSQSAHYSSSHQRPYYQASTFRRENPNNSIVNNSNNNSMRQQQTNEHIYDDIVYNRMVL